MKLPWVPRAQRSILVDPSRPKWPLKFRLIPPPPSPHPSPVPQFWTHELYRSRENETVKTFYRHTPKTSEPIAVMFLRENVVGFDMQWPPQYDKGPGPLQLRKALIQIACQDKIALFHIERLPGETTEDIVAPSLRKIIETPHILKTGVAILDSFLRLKGWFGLNPRGVFELSHLHNLVTHGPTAPELVTTEMPSLNRLVETHLGYPLHEGDSRKRKWRSALKKDHVRDAAVDAYAGLMLFHCMNAKRASMRPLPPLPIHADRYQRLKCQSDTNSVMLRRHGRRGPMSVAESYGTALTVKKTPQPEHDEPAPPGGSDMDMDPGEVV